MGRAPCCEKVGLKRGRWTAEEDEILRKYIETNGEGSWRSLPRNAGLLRCGKSCRLRWINYLRSDLKRGNISAAEEEIIINLHASMGNRWSLIAGHLPGRTDNEIKNYWNSHLSRKIYVFRRPNPHFIPPPVAKKPENRTSSKKKSKQNGRKNKPKEKSNNSGVKIMATAPTPEKESFPTTGDIIPEEMGMEMENWNLCLDNIMEDLSGILDSGELEESGPGMELEKNEEWNLDSREWDWGQEELEEDIFSWFRDVDVGEESGKTGSFNDGSISFGSDTEKHNELVSWLMS